MQCVLQGSVLCIRSVYLLTDSRRVFLAMSVMAQGKELAEIDGERNFLHHFQPSRADLMPSSQGQNNHGQRWACGTQLALIWILTSATKYKYCGTLTTVHVPLPASAANSTTWEGFSKSHCFQCPQSHVKGQTVARGWKLEKAAFLTILYIFSRFQSLPQL